MVYLLILACSNVTVERSQIIITNQLTDRQYLRRLSLDIRGKVPTPEECRSFDSTLPESTIDTYLLDDGFGSRIRAIYSNYYGTVTDQYQLTGSDFLLEDEISFRESIGQEPLALLSHVAENDLPWHEIVTADYTLGNDLLLSIFPLEEVTSSSEEWRKVRYTDGRPLSGLLSSNGLWWRYMSTASNANRLRANAVSTLFLCNNYLERPITFERDNNLLNPEGLSDAIKNDPNCVNCHSTLDPLAAHLFGFWAPQADSWMEASFYHPERERLWEDVLSVPPGYFGQTSNNITDLGRKIATDPRFASCAVEQIMSHFLAQKINLADAKRIVQHREAFLESGLTMRSLIRSVVQDPDYKVGHLNADQEGTNAKLLKLDQLVSSIEDLTGFRWKYAGFDMFDNDIIGLRSLAGGSDGRAATQAATVPNATLLLVHSALAEQAAIYATIQELEQESSERKFFNLIDLEQTWAQSTQAEEQIVHLFNLILTQEIEADGIEVQTIHDLWQAVYQNTQNPSEAWVSVMIAILRDPNYLIY